MSSDRIYRIVKRQTEGVYKEKGSKFFAFVIPCANSEEAKLHIASLRKQNPNAVHVCFAWRFGKVNFEDRFSDDGEPNNSAGKPIFGQILAYNITNVLIAVVRYYGGTNLGVGGLITAYKTAAKDALDKAVIEENFVSNYFQIRYTYNQTGEIMNLLQKTGVEIIEQKFDDKGPLIVFKISQSKSQRLKEEFDNKPNYQLTLSASDK